MAYAAPSRDDAHSAVPRYLGRTHHRVQQGVASMALVNSIYALLQRDEEGQGLAEYALILALIAIVAIVALIFLGGKVSTVLSTVGKSI
jgi:pilus assembly protein Flp/PilA